MKNKLLIFSFFAISSIGNTQTIPNSATTNPDWNLVFTENFSSAISPVNWETQFGENRWLQEQVFLKDLAVVNSGDLLLKLGICNPCKNEVWDNTEFLNGNGFTARYGGSEVYTQKKFLYGYIEANVTMPTGVGAFPGVWLMPIYRERHVDGWSNGYPEEIDIIEQRSIVPVTQSATTYYHLNDFNMFWNNDSNVFAQAIDDLKTFVKYPANNVLADGQPHLVAAKWDLFGVQYYIDGVLAHSNDLWDRKTNTESMNLMLSNQIMTDTSDPHQNPSENVLVDNTTLGGYQMTFPTTSNNDILNEIMVVHDVHVFQQKKYRNPVVWASGKSDKLGDVTLETGPTKFNKFVVGNFDPSDSADEILTFATGGQNCALQRLTNERTLITHDMRLHQDFTHYHNDVWSYENLWNESGTAYALGLNNWQNTTNGQYSKMVAGNFDGIAGDEIFLSNHNSMCAVVRKFDFASPGNLMQELYNNGSAIPANNNIKTDSATWPLGEHDVFIAADFNGITTGGKKDELLCLNYTTGNIMVFTPATGGSYYWANATGVVTNSVLGSWTIRQNDQYIAADFSDNDGNEELLCINHATGEAQLFDFIEIATDTWGWQSLWNNAPPYKITDWVMTTNLAAKSKFLAGNFLDHTQTQLLCISADQIYSHLYQFNNATKTWVPKQYYTQAANIPQWFECFSYKYEDSYYHNDPHSTANRTTKSALLSVERYYNPNTSVTPTAKNNYNAKYFTSLVGFSEEFSPAIWNASPRLSIGKTNEKMVLYPNPAGDEIQVSIEGSIKLYDMGGRLLYSSETSANIPTGNLPKGSYVIAVTNIKGTQSAIFVKN